MSAKQKQGMAALEEFLQDKYVENYEKFNENDTKVKNMQLLYPEYFYIPVNEKVGALTYIVNNEGHIFYLIKKSGLPKEIKDGLVGGDAGDGTYNDYATLNDVYGVTSDLKVYYSSSPNSKILGITEDEFDVDDTSREVFSAGSPLSDLINKGDKSKNVTAEDARGVDSLTIDQNSGITNFEDFYNLPSLETLKLNNINIENLSGIENAMNLSAVYLTGVTCGDYSSLGKLGKNLTELYIINSKDAEIDKIFGTYDEVSKIGVKNGISNFDLPNLKVLEISGLLITRKNVNGGLRTTNITMSVKNNNITKISQLNNLSNVTKTKIESLLINNNNIKSLEGIEGLTSIKTLRAETNSVNNIDGLEKINLEYCFLCNNIIGNNNEEALKSLENINGSHSKLEYLRIDNNKIQKVSYLASYKSSDKIESIYGKGNDSITDISELIVLNGKCYYEFDEKYSLSLLDDSTTELNLSNQELTFDNLIGIGRCRNMQKLSLGNVKIKNNDVIISNQENTLENRNLAQEKVSDMLKNFSKIVDLDLDGCKFITNLEFMKEWNKSNLKRIRISNTSINNMSILNEFENLNGLMCYNSPCKVNDLNDSVIIKLLQSGRAVDFFGTGNRTCSFDIDDTQSSQAIWPKTGLTSINVWDSEHAKLLDFSTVNTITSFYVGWCSTKFKFDPTNITRFDGFGADVIFSENKKGGHIVGDFDAGTVTMNSILSSFSSVDYEVRNNDVDFSNYSNCDKIVRFSNFKQYESDFSYKNMDRLTNLQTLELLNGGNITISDISSLTKLTTVKIADPIGSDILTKLPIENLVTLELTNSKFTDISPLINASKLETLNLEKGLIYDRFSYGDKTNVSTLQTFINLRNQYNKLKKLYLSGCKNILDWSILEKSEIKWDDWSGFNGK